MKRLYISSFILLAAMGCQKGEGLDAGSQVVSFTTASEITRVTEDGKAWEDGDAIGIFMFEGEQESYTNVEYRTTNTTSGTQLKVHTAGSEILLPNGGSGTTFKAYYPYREDGTSSAIMMDVTDQSDQGALDLLMATSIWAGNENQSVALSFDHLMAKMVLDVELLFHADIETLKAELTEVTTAASYDTNCTPKVITSQPQSTIEMLATVGSDKRSATITATLHAGDALGELVLTINGVRYGALDISNATLPAGHIYGRTILVGESVASFEGKNTISGWNDENIGSGSETY